MNNIRQHIVYIKFRKNKFVYNLNLNNTFERLTFLFELKRQFIMNLLGSIKWHSCCVRTLISLSCRPADRIPSEFNDDSGGANQHQYF